MSCSICAMANVAVGKKRRPHVTACVDCCIGARLLDKRCEVCPQQLRILSRTDVQGNRMNHSLRRRRPVPGGHWNERMACMLGAQLHRSAHLHGCMPSTMHASTGGKAGAHRCVDQLVVLPEERRQGAGERRVPLWQLGDQLQVALPVHECMSDSCAVQDPLVLVQAYSQCGMRPPWNVAGRQYLHTNLVFFLLHRKGCTTLCHLLMQLQHPHLRLEWHGLY